VLQCVAVCCSVLQCAAVYQWSSLHRYLVVAAMGHCDCFVLQCVAVCCSVLQCVAVYQWSPLHRYLAVAAMGCCDCVALQNVCGSVLQCVAVCYSKSMVVTSSVSGGSGHGML